MAYGGVHLVGPMQINVGAGGPIIIDQVEGMAFNIGNRVVTKATDGDVDPTWTSIESEAPRFSGSTNKLKTFLANVGISGYIPTNSGVAIYNRGVDLTTALRKTGAVQESVTFASSLIVPRTLRVAQGEPGAKITFDVIGVNASGQTNPAVLSQTATLPALGGVAEFFTMGPMKIAGVNYEGMQEYTLDFGIQLGVKMGTGAVYPQLVYIEERKPKITFKTNDSSLLNAITLLGTAVSGTCEFYLRSFASSGVRTSDGSAAHISFIWTKGLFYVTDKGGSHPKELGTTIVCEPVYDGTNAIIQINTATTIT